jgi:hypothetical protein
LGTQLVIPGTASFILNHGDSFAIQYQNSTSGNTWSITSGNITIAKLPVLSGGKSLSIPYYPLPKIHRVSVRLKKKGGLTKRKRRGAN